jgi:hypothetical protein
MYLNKQWFRWNGNGAVCVGCRFGIRQDHSIEFGCCDLTFAWFCVVGEVVPKVIYFRSLLGRQRFVLSLRSLQGCVHSKCFATKYYVYLVYCSVPKKAISALATGLHAILLFHSKGIIIVVVVWYLFIGVMCSVRKMSACGWVFCFTILPWRHRQMHPQLPMHHRWYPFERRLDFPLDNQSLQRHDLPCP